MAINGEKWSEEKVEAVLQSFALGGNYSATSRECGVPITTVRRWVSAGSERVAEIKEEYLTACTDEFIKGAIEFRDEFGSGIRKRLLDCIKAADSVLGRTDLTEREEEMLGSMRGKDRNKAILALFRSRVSGIEVAALLRELMKAHQLLEGEATDRPEVTVLERILEKVEEKE